MACCKAGTQKGQVICPVCGQHCLLVSKQTILHHVQFPDNQSLSESDYMFCANRNCTIAYFSTSSVISTSQLRAFQPNQPTMLCYCFDISELTYRKALTDGTSKLVKAFVVQQTKAALCACECRNPSGRCCLANFHQMQKDHDC